jgi:hypothetical protein
MFDELIKELRRLDGRQVVSVSIPSDADGYFDRECPGAVCQFKFKVHEDDWREKVRDEEVHCPFCGHTAHAMRGGPKNSLSTPKRPHSPMLAIVSIVP